MPASGMDAIGDLPRQLILMLGELLLLGLDHSEKSAAAAWHELSRHGEALGYDRLALPATAGANAHATQGLIGPVG